MEIGKMLKEKRAEYELTQEQLSEQIFVSKKTISNWETGKTTPDIDSLIRLATLFNLSLDNLLLEGSDVVENIKIQSEIKNIRIYQCCMFITNLAFILIVLLGKLELAQLIILLIATVSNTLVLIYLTKKIYLLSEKKMKNKKNKVVLSFIISILFFAIYMILKTYL